MIQNKIHNQVSNTPDAGASDSSMMTNDTVQNSPLVVDAKVFGSKKTVDPNANAVKSVSLTKQQLEDMTELDAVFNASIIAKPLMMPEGLNIIVKNKEYSYRWVAFKTKGGENLSKFQYMGYTKADLNDVDPQSEKAASNPDGIILGDLLLMKIPKELYLGHIKENYRRANIAATRMGQTTNDANKIREMFPGGIPTDSTGQPVGGFYKPGDEEVSKSLKNNAINISI
jgi:hypothetical protein